MRWHFKDNPRLYRLLEIKRKLLGWNSTWKNASLPCDREIDLEPSQVKPNLDCNYIFPIDLAPKVILFCAKSIGKVLLQSKLCLISQDSRGGCKSWDVRVYILLWIFFSYRCSCCTINIYFIDRFQMLSYFSFKKNFLKNKKLLWEKQSVNTILMTFFWIRFRKL